MLHVLSWGHGGTLLHLIICDSIHAQLAGMRQCAAKGTACELYLVEAV
jgi:hypothetical protein